MAIKIQPSGLGVLFGKLGQLAGKAQQARREEERISTIHRQLAAQQHTIEMRAFEAQLDIEAEKRARQWQLEKMEISSRADFMREEQRRLKRLDEKQARLDALEQAVKDGVIDSDDYNTAVLQEVTDIPFYTQGQIAGRAAERPTTARVPTESQYAYLSSQGYSDEDIRTMFGLTAPDMTPTAAPVTTQTIPDWKSKIGQEVAVVDGVSYTYNETGEFVPIPTTDKFGGGLGERFRGYGAGGTWEGPTAEPTETKKLDIITAQQILREAGGDKEKARTIARSRGYSL